MNVAFDTYYLGNKAKTVCVAFEHWADEHPQMTYNEILEGVEEYQPGQFYKRELPCIMSLLRQIDIATLGCIVIDGYTVLDDHGKNGLGGHLFCALDKKIPIIGVAKSNFFALNNGKIELFRGKSQRPLYITAIGLDVEDAAQKIFEMHGEFRIPTLLKLVDSYTKESIF